MNRSHFPRFPVVAALGVVLTVASAGCSSKHTLSADFTASITAPTPGLVKLVRSGSSGSLVLVDALIIGAEPVLDLSAFKFGIKIGDDRLVKLVPQSSYVQTALVAGAGQTIAIDVDGTSDPSLVQIDVEKQGGGAGNGIAGTSAVVIELAFQVQGSGTSTLTLVGLGADPPQAIDSARAPIAAVTFDAASASVMGVTGGGGY